MSSDSETLNALKKSAIRMRINSIKATNACNSGHPTSCASAAEIMSVLFLKVMKYHVKEPRNPNSDRFVLSKGHAAPILYAAWAEVGLFPSEDLLNLRKIDNDLEGHPTPRLSFVDVATGSLGQGLSAAAGMAYTGKHFDKGSSYRVYCLIGDGESAEGSIWEAMSFASHYQLDNLVAIFDVNRLGQSQPTALQHQMNVYQARSEAFGFHTIVVDGHDIPSLINAFAEAEATKGKPTAIIARTFKGRDMEGIEDKENWHGKPVGPAGSEAVLNRLTKELESLGGAINEPASICPCLPATNDLAELNLLGSARLASPPDYKIGDEVATRAAYGTALAKLGVACDRVIGLDADTKNSTYSIKLLEKKPEQFIECFIAEQNMVGVGIGCTTRNRTIAFVSTFACFFTRAYDQLRMGAISQTNCNFSGSHAGISIGEDGPSQMGLEDFAMFRAIPGSTVFYPSDAVSTERAVELAANTKGICFIRTGRPNCPVIYPNEAVFEIGKGKVVHSSGPNTDVATVVGAGVTLFEAIKAANILAGKGVNIRVIDPFTLKPIDKELLLQAARETNGRIVTVEDHYYEGGLGEAVLSALADVPKVVIKRLAVGAVPRSGKSKELMALFAIDAAAIIKTVESML